MTRRLKILVAIIGLSIICGGGFYFYARWRAHPVPTIAGWRANVSTFAGDGLPGVRDDVDAHTSRFTDPFGIAVDEQGNLYVADAGASNRIRKLTPQGGAVSTFAGGAAEGFAEGAGTQAAFNTPSAIAFDGAGNLYVADTGNHRVRKVTPEGQVSTLAGDGNAGWRDGAAAQAEFNAPVGVAVDSRNGNVYVADTYNDRIRLITAAGQVQTIAGGGVNSDGNDVTDSGGGAPGYADGAALSAARFDTPCALAVTVNGDVLIADTGNDRVRRLTPDGQVTTLSYLASDGARADAFAAPIGLALTHDKFLYVAEAGVGRITQIAPDGRAHLVAGVGTGFADGDGWDAARFLPGGIAVDHAGDLYVADSGNFVVRHLMPRRPATQVVASGSSVKAEGHHPLSPLLATRLTAEVLGVRRFPWPLAPQEAWHEMAATMGEVRGSYDGEARDHLHSGVDVRGADGELVRAVVDEKVRDPLAAWGFNQLHEGLRVNLLAYIHLRVGRDGQGAPLPNAAQFSYVRDAKGKTVRVRVRRGARFRVGDPLGAINRMYHVHLNFGPTGRELNSLALPFIGFADTTAPTIEPGGVQLLVAADNRSLKPTRGGRIIVPREDVRIVVDAYDQVDGNLARRRLGLYRLGYQILLADGTTPAPGFAQPRDNFDFAQLPPARDAVRIAYADASGITVYGSLATKFLYEATNTVRHGQAARGTWHAAELSPGDYTLRIFAADFAGNLATANRDVAFTLE